MSDTENPWSDETEYLSHLRVERHMFAWALERYGDLPSSAAASAAETFYAYEPPSRYRGLLFHDDAWHWAMLHLHGDNYWMSNPGLETPPVQFEDEWRRISDAADSRQT